MNVDQFQLEEYKLRVQEVQDLMKEARQLELYCAGVVAALFSWLISTELSTPFGWFIPAIIPILGMIRSWAIYERVRQITQYIKQVESSTLAETDLPQGWETWYAGIREHSLTPSGILFWLILIVVCVIFAVLNYSGTP